MTASIYGAEQGYGTHEATATKVVRFGFDEFFKGIYGKVFTSKVFKDAARGKKPQTTATEKQFVICQQLLILSF